MIAVEQIALMILVKGFKKIVENAYILPHVQAKLVLD